VLVGVGRILCRELGPTEWIEVWMPIILGVDHECKQVDAVAVGPVTHADVENHLLTERHFGGLACEEFIDARCAGVLFTPDETRQIVALLRRLGQESKLGPAAVWVSTDIAFGLMRMLEILVEDVAIVKPFRDEQEARGWLASQKQDTPNFADSLQLIRNVTGIVL
jgi:hypothetical protein